MDTKKSLGVDEKSSKLAMSSCLTWMGSQSSMTNLSRERMEELKLKTKTAQNMNHLQVILPNFVATGI